MKMKFTVLLFFIFPVFVHAQAFQIDKPPLPIDSLQKALPLLHDSARVDCLNELARSYTEEEMPELFDTAWLLVKQAYAEASAINYIKGLGDACFRFGHLSQWWFWDFKEMEKYHLQSIFWYKKIGYDEGLGHANLGLGLAILRTATTADEARKAFEQSIYHFRKTGNKVMLAEVSDRLAYVYNAKGDFERFFEMIKQGLKEKKRIGDNRGLIRSYYNLGHIYQSVGDYETALGYFRLSSVQAQSQLVPWHIGNSMGGIFVHLKNYDSAIYYYQDVFKHLPTNGGAFAGLGKLYLLQKKYDTALNFLENAITSFSKRNNNNGIVLAMLDVAKIHAAQKQYAKALQYAKHCLTEARRLDLKDAIQQAYEILWNIYENLHQTDSAYFYYSSFVPLRDSLENERLKLQHIQKLTLYKVEAREEQQQAHIALLNKDNQLKQQQLQEESLQKKILIGSLAASLVLGIIIFRNIALKRRNEKHQRELAENELQIQKLESEKIKAELQQQATELEMQALRSQMNPHFIFNCLSSINRFILKNETEAASDYLTKFSRLIRMVLNNSKDPVIILEDELEMLRLYLDLERLRFKNSFDYSISFYNHFDISSIFIPPLLLQPFAENAIWHGLMHKEGKGSLEISFELEDDILNCYITDNGIGREKAEEIRSKSAERQKSLGMQITAGRIALLNRNAEQTIFEIEDLVDAQGYAAGTRVILKIKYKESFKRYL